MGDVSRNPYGQNDSLDQCSNTEVTFFNEHGLVTCTQDLTITSDPPMSSQSSSSESSQSEDVHRVLPGSGSVPTMDSANTVSTVDRVNNSGDVNGAFGSSDFDVQPVSGLSSECTNVNGSMTSQSDGANGMTSSESTGANGMTSKANYTKHTKAHCKTVPNGAQSVKKGGDSESSMNINSLEIPPRQPSGSGTGTARHKVNKSGNMAYTIPEVEITIPNDGCLASFSADAMATFFRYVRLEDRLINHLHRNGLDGRKFGRLKDSDLDNLQINNPIIVYFRDRTAPAVAKKNKQRLPFVL